MKFLIATLFSFFAFSSMASGVGQIRFDQIKVISAGSMTGTSTINSTVMDLDQHLGVGCQAIWSGTPNGTVKLQASNDIGTASNWTDVPNDSTTISGSAGSSIWTIDPVEYRWLRVTYTNTSSTGTLNATCGFHH